MNKRQRKKKDKILWKQRRFFNEMARRENKLLKELATREFTIKNNIWG